MHKKIAIVTGASSGLGVEFAKQIDKKKILDEIWLVARREQNLKEVARQLKKSKGIILKTDLTKKQDIQKLIKKLEKEKPNLRLLVNNAGFGKKGYFQKILLKTQQEMIELNVKALVTLTYEGIKYMTKGSEIIQVASTAGFAPLPGFNVYSATKAFVLNFANALNEELKSKGIHTIAVCPGPVKTEFTKRSEGKSIIPKEATAKKVVAKALKDLKKKRWTSIYSFRIKILAMIMKLLPRKWIVEMSNIKNKGL
jgi:hypothetical protein